MLRLFFVSIIVATSLRGLATPQPVGIATNNSLSEMERQSISIGPFVIHETSKTEQEEKSRGWLAEGVIPLLRIIIWPLIFWAVVYYFRKEIGGILGSVKSIKGKEYSVEMSERLSEQQKLASNLPPASGTASISGNNLSGEFEKAKASVKITPALEEVAQKVREELSKSPFTPEQKVELGIFAISRVALVSEFWRIYNFIFGTQMELLQQLNTRPYTESDLQIFFDRAQQKFPEMYKGSTSRDYINFLLVSSLIEQRTGNYLITAKGKEFLVWCIESNLALNKAW